MSFPEMVAISQNHWRSSPGFYGVGAVRGVRHLLNNARCPTQNAYIECFNGEVPNECLNEQWSESLTQAEQEIARWRRGDNEGCPAQLAGAHAAGRFCFTASPACLRCRETTGDQAFTTPSDSLTQHWQG